MRKLNITCIILYHHENSLSTQNPYPIRILARNKPLSSYKIQIVTRKSPSLDAIPILPTHQNPNRNTQIPILSLPLHADPYPRACRKYAVFRENGRPLVMRQISLQHPFCHVIFMLFSSPMIDAWKLIESKWSIRVVPAEYTRSERQPSYFSHAQNEKKYKSKKIKCPLWLALAKSKFEICNSQAPKRFLLSPPPQVKSSTILRK